MECEALGFPVPQITWYLNDSALSTNSSLVEIIEARKSEHEGLYRCEAKNPAGIVTASASVTVRGQYNEYTFLPFCKILLNSSTTDKLGEWCLERRVRPRITIREQ